jgi:hypothetical protein
MTALAYRTASLLVGARRGADVDAAGPLTLRDSEDGWVLIGSDGEVVFRALGIRARRECLEFARRRGVCVVLS